MMRRWMLVLVMLIVGTLCSTAFQAQVDTTGSPPGLQPGRAVNPKPFDKFRAPVSGTVAFLFSDRAKALFRASNSPLARAVLKLAGEQPNMGVAPRAGASLGAGGGVLPSYQPRQAGIPMGVAPILGTVNSGCGTSVGTRFNLEPTTGLGTLPDPIAMPQNEETIDALLSGGINSADLIVEGANDFRGFFGPDPFGALGGSLTGYYVHTSGTNCAPQFEGGAPSIPDPFGGSDLFGAGDPVVAIDAARSTVFEADLRFNEDDSVIAVQRTTVLNLKSTGVCPNGTHNTDAAARACWPTGIAVNPLPTEGPEGSLLYFNDKPHMTVDQRQTGTGAGNVYITATEFDSFSFLGAGSRIWLISCTNDLSSCSSPTLISGSDLSTQFSHVSVRPDGIVTVSYQNFVPGPTFDSLAADIRFVSCTPTAAPATPSCSPPVSIFPPGTVETNILFGTDSLSSNHFRIATYPKHDHRTNGTNIETFMVWDRCDVNPFTVVPGFYICPKSDIRMFESVNATGATGGAWTEVGPPVDSAAKDQFFPWIKTDRASNTVNITYYTAEGDFYSHKVAVKLAQINPGGTAPESITGTTIMTGTDDPAADPFLANFGQDFFGDYIGVAAVSHRAYVGFTFNTSNGKYSGLFHAEQNNHVARFDY